jgi:putative glutamine amidotransferase
VVARLDGLVISGGADVSPERYAQQPHERTTSWREDRDAWELALLDAADAAGLPVLGVCRGMQVMAVHAGGALEQHVPDLVGHERHNPAAGVFGETEVSLVPGTRLASMLGTSLTVHCHHHQSVRSHPGFAAAALAEDGLLEAMEAPGDRLCLAVQWHPEMAADAGLFKALAEAASQRPRRR